MNTHKFFAMLSPTGELAAEMARKPFSYPETVAYMYCKKCGLVFELDRGNLDNILHLIGEAGRVRLNIGEFDPKKQYIQATSCHECGDMPDLSIVSV